MKKLFALICVIALLGAFCVPAMAAINVPVAAQVPADWTTVYLYAWGDSGEAAAWPGVPMVNIDDWYCAYMPDNMTGVIINNGSGVQTGDLTVESGMPVCVMAADPAAADVEYELPVEVPEEDAMPKPPMDAVHAKVPAEWTTVNLYAWNDNGSNAGWPGVPMTQGDDGLWLGELTPGYANIIVNDGANQTVDLPYAGGECWVVLKDAPTGKFEAAVVYEEPTDYDNVESAPAPTPVLDACYVAGTMNDWNCADEAYKMTDNGDGTYTITFNLTAGDHALKVTNGTWDVSFGGTGADGNYEFNVPADGTYTVTFDGTTVTVVEGTGATTGTDSGSDTGSDNGSTEEGGANVGLIAGIAGGVVVLGGGAAAVVAVNKKKKEN